MRTLSNLLLISAILLSSIILGSCSLPAQSVSLAWLDGKVAFLSRTDIIQDGQILESQRAFFLMDLNGKMSGFIPGTQNSLASRAAWSPDGTAMAIVAWDEPSQSFCLKIISETREECLVGDAPVRGPSWSPDGKWLAYFEFSSFAFSAKGSNDLILAMNLESREVIVLAELPSNKEDGDASVTTWSPDSAFVAYDVTMEDGTENIWIVSLEDREAQLLIPNGLLPAWSSRDEIAFRRDGQIWLYDFNTGNETLFLDFKDDVSWPAWSPDGEEMLFAMGINGQYDIFIIDRNGQNIQRLTETEDDEAAPSWRPQPALIC